MKRILHILAFLLLLPFEVLFAQGPRNAASSVTPAEGYTNITYRGKKAFLECNGTWVRDAEGNSRCDGWTIIRADAPVTGKAMAHLKYVDGKRDSMCREWDRENDIIHVINYDRGKILSAEIIRISDRKILAKDVAYANGYEDDGEIINHMVIGYFTLGKHLRGISADYKGKDFAYFKSQYVDEPVGNPFADVDKQPNPFTNYSGQSNAVAASKYNAGTVAACDQEIRRIYGEAKNAIAYYNAAYEEEKGYRNNRLNYESQQKQVISDCDKAIAEYRDQVPSDRIYQLNEIRSEMNSHNLPMGIMKSMPVRRE